MTQDSWKGYANITSFPHTLSTILILGGWLALFLIIASSVLISQPIESAISGYYYSVDKSVKIDFPASIENQPSPKDSNVRKVDMIVNNTSTQPRPKSPLIPSSVREDKTAVNSDASTDKNYVDSKSSTASDLLWEGKYSSSNTKSSLAVEDMTSSSPPSTNTSNSHSVDLDCDLYHGHWYYDSTGPLYTNNTCPVLTQTQNCQGNGRPDKEYENYRWRPSQCDLPRFDSKKFLELMEGKTVAFIGDSVARNQMESLLCILWQIEAPKNRVNRKMQRWYFRSTNTKIVRIWSSWLVHRTTEPFDFAPQGVNKLHLDVPDETFMKFIPGFDVIVLSSGHWFPKQSVYIMNNQILGGQLWWPDNSRPQKINNVEAFGVSVETILTAMATHPNYTGLTIVRSYSPDHYRGGAWNTGGSCTGKVKPAAEIVENGFTNKMHEKQVNGFKRAAEKQNNKSKLRLMDITEAFGYRPDGHPGPYRSPDPNKLTKLRADGIPTSQDCLHWCMPGPVDTWNEIFLEIIRREFEGKEEQSS